MSDTSAQPPAQTWLFTLGIMIIGSNSFVLSPILTDVARTLATEPVAVARAISAFGGATALASFVFAFSSLSERVGARRVLMAGALVMMLGLVGSGLSATWWHLAAAQGLIGTMVGVMLPTIYAAATASAPPGQGGRALGRVIRGWGIALVLGVPFSAFAADLFGWRAVYFIFAGAALVSFGGFARLPSDNHLSVATTRLGPVGALKVAGAAPALAVCALYMIGFYGLYPYLGDHVRTAFGASATAAGLVVLSYGAGFGLASFAMGPVDRAGPRLVFPGIMLLLAAIYLVLGPLTATMALALPTAFVWGLANHVGVNLIIQMLSGRSAASRGALVGLHTTITYAAIFAGPLIMGAVYAERGFGTAAWVSAVLLAAAGGIAFAARRHWR